jgi:predicted metal-dependent enzyme (double-stranded beta helix superfamily)
MSLYADMSLEFGEKPGQDPFGGVHVERRDILRASLGALAALTLGWPRRVLSAAAGTSADGSWEALIRQVMPIAEALVRSHKPDEEGYLRRLASLAARLNAAPDAVFDPHMPVAGAYAYRQLPLIVLQLRLAPGAEIPFHDHREYNGVLMVVSGEAQIRSFDIVQGWGVSPGRATFLIRETRSEVLAAREVSTLSRTRDNIHIVRAGDTGARLLDFFTLFQPDGRSVYMKVDERPRDPGQRIYEASWM